MPSGAKKRKAAKKKMRKETHNDGAHPQGNDEPKSQDERESDGGEAEREQSEEGAVENHEEGTKEISLGWENAAEIVKEVMAEDNLQVVTVEAQDVAMESQNGDASLEHKSSSGSSSEVAVEKEKSVVEESVESVVVEEVEAEHEGERSLPEVVASEETLKPVENVPEAVSSENSAPSEMVHNSAGENVAVEESVKEGVSLTSESILVTESPSESIFVTESPSESTRVTESVVVENAMASETIESELKQKVEEVLPMSDEKDKNSPPVLDLVVEKIETTVVEVVERGSENLPEPVEVTAGENEALLPQSSGVTTVERNGGADHVKELEKLKQSDEQPLVSSAPLPVRRTSWMNCCGLFEVLSGGSRR